MLALCGAAAIGMLPGGASAREVSIPFLAANFSDPLVINNSYFPLVAGATFTYKAATTDGCEVDVTTVTNDTRLIDGVTTRIVHDTAYEGETCTTDPSALAEDTLDYYAQDNAGNVWYFGEDTYHCPIGTCPRGSGSWIAGEDPTSAIPGTIMLAQARSGDTYFQEQAPGVAQDQATVTSTGVTVKLHREDAFPPGTFSDCIVTKEFSALEKGSTEQKSYCPGIGNVLVEEHHGKKLTSELTGLTAARTNGDAFTFRTVPGSR
jgi:hypothetical protein